VGDDFLVVSIRVSLAISLGTELAMFGDAFEWSIEGKFEGRGCWSDWW